MIEIYTDGQADEYGKRHGKTHSAEISHFLYVAPCLFFHIKSVVRWLLFQPVKEAAFNTAVQSSQCEKSVESIDNTAGMKPIPVWKAVGHGCGDVSRLN